ncbi:hypothetical protein FB446DRAFT_707148 [Lentinula raphanica]|nr:hypothetical protein FB446DRAFT_707148 [Lentinula raphanica]
MSFQFGSHTALPSLSNQIQPPTSDQFQPRTSLSNQATPPLLPAPTANNNNAPQEQDLPSLGHNFSERNPRPVHSNEHRSTCDSYASHHTQTRLTNSFAPTAHEDRGENVGRDASMQYQGFRDSAVSSINSHSSTRDYANSSPRPLFTPSRAPNPNEDRGESVDRDTAVGYHGFRVPAAPSNNGHSNTRSYASSTPNSLLTPFGISTLNKDRGENIDRLPSVGYQASRDSTTDNGYSDSRSCSTPHPLFSPSRISTPFDDRSNGRDSTCATPSLSKDLFSSSHLYSGNDDLGFRTEHNSASLTKDDKDNLRRFAEKTGNLNMLKIEQIQRLKRHIDVSDYVFFKPFVENRDLSILQYNTDGNIGNVKSSIAIHSAILEVANSVESQRVDYQAISELVANANRAANSKMVVGNDTRKMIQSLSKDRVISPSITSYTTMTHQLFDIVKGNAKKYECEDILEKPLGSKAIRAACNDAAKSALQQFRTALIMSLWGETTSSKKTTPKDPATLEVFTHSMMDKWRDGALGSTSGKDYQMRFAMIRVWLLKLGKETAMAASSADIDNNNNDDIDIDDSSSSSTRADQEPPTKRQRNNNMGGRTMRKKAFWSLFTDELTEKTKLWGTDLRKEEWKRYLADCVQQDWKIFGQGRQGLLAPLVLQPAESSASTQIQAPSAPIMPAPGGQEFESLGDDEP